MNAVPSSRRTVPARRWLPLLVLLLAGCARPGAIPPTVEDLPPHHVAGGGFRNPGVETRKRGLFRYLSMRWFGDDTFADQAADAHRVPRVEADPGRLARPAPVPRATWIGHATVLLQHRGLTLLTDPILSPRAGPGLGLGPRRHVPPALDAAQLPRIDFVVISHDHYDHLDRDTVQALGDGPLWLVPLGVRRRLIALGIAPDRIVELDWWQTHAVGHARFTATPAQHWSGRGLFDRYATLWSSWAIDLAGWRVWFAGDTGYRHDLFTEIGVRAGPFDLALVPIGAYAPRWFMRDMHVDPAEAVRIVTDVRARRAIGIHWGTFQLSAEPVDAPARRLRAAAAAAGLVTGTVGVLAVGETRAFE